MNANANKMQEQNSKVEKDEDFIVKEEDIKIEEPTLQELRTGLNPEDLIIEKDKIKDEELALEEQNIHCKHLKRTFINKEQWQVHEKRQCKRRPTTCIKRTDIFQCDICEYKSNRKDSLKKHIMSIHRRDIAKWFTCDKCPYKTGHKGHLTTHKLVHSDTYACVCPLCRKSFRRKHSLDNHLLHKHFNEFENVRHFISSKVYECNVCGQYRTVFKSHFFEHLEVTHLEGAGGHTKHSCPHCSYSTFYKSHLNEHMLTHSSAKPHVCIACHKGFVSKRQLDGHIISQHKTDEQLLKTITSKVHECSECLYKTVRLSNLKNHQKRSHIQE